MWAHLFGGATLDLGAAGVMVARSPLTRSGSVAVMANVLDMSASL
jgi:hypothetical protein